MHILLALILGAAIGLAAELLVPGRDARGAALAPVMGALVAGAAWAMLTWFGVGITDPVIWVVAVLAPALIVPLVLIVLTRVRASRDAQERRRLRIG
ncbi:hypothetical protein [Microbacterium imperiale]|uniref:Uncharacterized protein n=1 Tax=Microbacterium imperiale TaxID=33884 RepID=A0A9W6HFY0_9MICO|nr:hypothetical protein [Microbacterium imperiale]MBP2419338.1 putative membrane protein YeaQ/YmgE (transglycosylase-associated protein family) [Microbacterium imperiale]MDS0198792.1 hypothetical protein [Microbacterium imperiale]BFE39680.1 hypothetical protein GCM10017544_06360 [Microbacterium imperiale]GLJ79345.1 hypothetical protein GCM10017586_10270 [Microbacterium imperiale]